MTLRELHLFAGSGGGLLGSLLLGHRPVCAVEIDPYCRRVLAARRDEGWLPAEMEIHDDVTTFDGHAWRGRVDLVAGGFPCQDISVAGKGAGLDGQRSGLFFQLLRVVREVRPKWVYLENVPAITSRGLDRVLGALAELGFDAEWCVLSAADAGAPHLRKRWWCLARSDAEGRGLAELRSASQEAGHADGVDAHPDAAHDGCVLGPRGDADQRTLVQAEQGTGAGDADRWSQPRGRCGGDRAVAADADDAGREEQRSAVAAPEKCAAAECSRGRATEPRLGRAPDGLAEWLDASARGYWAGDWETQPRLAQGQTDRVARLRALGNGQVPQTAAMAFRILMQRYEDNP